MDGGPVGGEDLGTLEGVQAKENAMASAGKCGTNHTLSKSQFKSSVDCVCVKRQGMALWRFRNSL